MLIEKHIPADVLERNWDDLANAMNEVTPDKVPVFLGKLALLLSATLDDPAQLKQYIAVALQDIMPDLEVLP